MQRVRLRRASWLLATAALLTATAAEAQQEEQDTSDAPNDEQASASEQAEGHPKISGATSLGGISTSGNTESESLNFSTEAEIEYAVWRHATEASGYQASEGDETTAERYRAAVQSDYKFSQRSYFFANVNYAVDRFGPFEERYAGALGVGRRFVDSDSLRLDLELGAGRRVQDPQGEDEAFGETIARFNGDLRWRLADGATLSQALEVEDGDSNTYAESVTAVKSQLAGSWALSLSHTIQYNSDVADAQENTDLISTISLEYGF